MAIIKPTGLIESAYRVRLTFTSPILGSQPSSQIALDFVRSRQIKELAAELKRNTEGLSENAAVKKATEIVNDSTEMSPEERAESAVQVTVFYRDSVGPHLMDYQVKGHAKEARKALDIRVAGKSAGTTVYGKQYVESGLWIFPWNADHGRRLYFYRDGVEISDVDDMLQRPKRVQMPTGEQKTSIAVSEVINPPVEVRFDVALLKQHRLKRSHVEEMLSYGYFQGLMQWRGAGFGRFVADLEEIAPKDVGVPA